MPQCVGYREWQATNMVNDHVPAWLAVGGGHQDVTHLVMLITSAFY